MTESRNWKVPFFTIWTGQAVSLLGSQLVQFALVWWLTKTTNSATVLATATTVGLLPTILLGPFAGTLVDRWPRKWVLILSDGSTAFFTALLSLLFWLDIAQPWHVYVILFLRSLGNAFQTPAMLATTPLMVPKDQLTRVASMNSTLQGILFLGAAPLGALLLELIEVKGVLPLDVLTAVLAIAPLFFVAVPQPAPESRLKGAKAVLGEMGQGLRYIWKVRPLRLMMGTTLVHGLLGPACLSFAPLIVMNHFGGGSIQLAWLNSAYGLGSILGGLLMSVWGGLKRGMATSALGGSVQWLGWLMVGLAPANAYWLAVAGIFLFGFTGPARLGGIWAALQKVVPPAMQGRFWGISQSVNQIVGPISLAIGAPMAEIWGVRYMYVLHALLQFTVFLLRRFVPELYYIEDRLAPGVATAVEPAEPRPAPAE